ncbi:hypothetical protein ACQCSX_22110 (plasmid) [Pseudarthrobacter sp. P1]|uniref:hypothetical protein n=1 Tax=Pseudarthrobacter sp. P1 TaxID=3418418 RepID=UPI003CE99EDD
MTENITRQPAGIPVGGQFAATSHAEPSLVLSRSADPERDHLRALMGVAARTGLSPESVNHIGSLMGNSPEPVYEENAATLAAAYAVTPENIKEIDRIANHGATPLTVAPGVDEAAADLLAAGGLVGHLEPYRGTNPDIEEGSLSYTSVSGRELALSNITDGELAVTYDDRHDEDNHFTLEQGTYGATPAEKVDTVREALWSLAVKDANYSTPGGLHNGHLYELRDTMIERGTSDATASFVVQNEDTGDFNIITHCFADRTTTIERDGDKLDGLAAEWELAAVFEDMRSEPDDGDFNAHAGKVFANLLATAAADADAPAWARTAAGQPVAR